MKKSFVVIGLGRFGESISKTLTDLGHEVLVIDQDERRVDDALDVATQAVQLDSTDKDALLEIGITDFDEAIVTIGSNLQSSILTTLILKELGMPKVTCKANNHYHSEILKKIGADAIVQPEWDMGIRVAHNLVSNNVIDYIELSPDYSLMEVKASKQMVGKTLNELEIGAKYKCTVMAIKPKDNHIMNISPQANDLIHENDVLVIIGLNSDINKFEQEILK